MATEEQLRDWQIYSLQEHLKLAQARAWTPNAIEVADLVIRRMDDKYSGTTKPNAETVADEVFSALKAVTARMAAPGVWQGPQPAPAPPAPVPAPPPPAPAPAEGGGTGFVPAP